MSILKVVGEEGNNLTQIVGVEPMKTIKNELA
jgi:hypothetical protein